MPEARTPMDVMSEILSCYRIERSCLIDAIMTDDKNARIKKALQCMGDRDDCVGKIKMPKASARDASRLRDYGKRTGATTRR